MSLSRSVIAELFKKNNLLDEFKEQEPVFVWTEVAGELGKITRPKKVKGDSLVLEVPSAAAKQELSFLEDDFLKKLNENLSYNRIEKLKFQLGEFRDESQDAPPEFNPDSVKLSEEELKKIDSAVAEADLGSATGDSLRQLLITQQKKRKIRLANGWKECPACGGVFSDQRCPYCGFPHGEVDTPRSNR